MGQIFINSIEKKDINKKLLRDVIAYPFNDTDGLSRFNVSFFLDSDLTSILISGGLLAKPMKQKEFDDIFKFNLDLCDIQKSVWGKLFYSFFEEFLLEHSNFKFECPLTKGFYHFTRFPLVDTSQLPGFLLKLDADFIFSVSMRAKAAGAKTLSRFMVMKIKGSVVW